MITMLSKAFKSMEALRAHVAALSLTDGLKHATEHVAKLLQLPTGVIAVIGTLAPALVIVGLVKLFKATRLSTQVPPSLSPFTCELLDVLFSDGIRTVAHMECVHLTNAPFTLTIRGPERSCTIATPSYVRFLGKDGLVLLHHAGTAFAVGEEWQESVHMIVLPHGRYTVTVEENVSRRKAHPRTWTLHLVKGCPPSWTPKR